MPTFQPESLEVFLFFVVPGFVALKVYELVMPTEVDRPADAMIALVAYSMINLAIMSWPMLLLSGRWADRPFAYYVGVIGVVFVSPALLALGWWRLHSRLSERGWVLSPMPTAWDHFFSKKTTRWALLHLKTGEKFGGFYGRGSHASSFPTDESLYLEQVWRVDEFGRFLEPVPRSAGLIVHRSDCHLIEFFITEEGSNGEGEAEVHPAAARDAGRQAGR